MLNSVTLMGRLVADPELKTTQNGTSVVSFRLAVERNYAPQGQERQADFLPCVAWRQTAEFIGKYFAKGRMIAVEGSLQSRNYEDKNGQKRTAIEVLVERAHFTGERAAGAEQTAAPPAAAAPLQTAAMPATAPPPTIPGDPYAPPAQYGIPGNWNFPGTIDAEDDPYSGDLPF